ncbi:MAG: hypothetical protein WDW36_005625 [Sanguina aurantia]
MQEDEEERSSYEEGEEDEPESSTGYQRTPPRAVKRKGARAGGAATAASAAASAQAQSLGVFGSPATLPASCRYDSSLGMLTKKFLGLIGESLDNVVEINKASDVLRTSKRRMYDITNVLEGVGLMEKKSKNNFRWKGNSTNGAGSGLEPGSEHEAAQVQADIASLQDQERSLDEQIASLAEALRAMTEHSANTEHLYVTDDDITALPCFRKDTIFVVRAPRGTMLEVPDPEDAAGEPGGSQRHRISLKSTEGQIDVYHVQHPNGNAMLETETPNQHHQPDSTSNMAVEQGHSHTQSHNTPSMHQRQQHSTTGAHAPPPSSHPPTPHHHPQHTSNQNHSQHHQGNNHHNNTTGNNAYHGSNHNNHSGANQHHSSGSHQLAIDPLSTPTEVQRTQGLPGNSHTNSSMLVSAIAGSNSSAPGGGQG